MTLTLTIIFGLLYLMVSTLVRERMAARRIRPVRVLVINHGVCLGEDEYVG